jgi:tetratricopeptide (TPR) repeat protein
LPVSLVFLAGLLVFLPGTSGNFIYDDTVEIRNVDDVFTPGAWPKLFVTAYSRLYRPVKYLSYYVDNLLFGWRPTGWHWQGCLWHALNGTLVFCLARRLGSSITGAMLGGIWFAVHPIHAEAVVWISARGALQSTLGVLMVLLCYDHWRQRPSGWAGTGMLGGAFIGFFSKEDALMVFPLLALHEWFIRRENPCALLKQKTFLAPVLALGALAVVYMTVRQSLISGLNQGRWAMGITGWLTTLPVILTTYLRQFIWPDPMCIDQPVDYAAGFGAGFWLSVLFLILCAAFLFMRRPAWSRWQFALGFFFVTLIPVMGIIPINQPRADRFLYLPSVAGALAVAWMWDWAGKEPRWRAVCLAFLAASLTWFCWRAWDYSKTFRNETALWENAIAINPASYRSFANLAADANNTNHPQLGLELAEKSIALNPDYIEGWVIKAYSLEKLGRTDEAETLYRRAIERGGEDPRWLYLLADLLQRQKQYPEAERLYDRIAQIRPGYVEARFAAGLLAIEMNEPGKAETHWMAVLQFDPANQQARYNLDLLRRQKSPPVPQQK